MGGWGGLAEFLMGLSVPAPGWGRPAGCLTGRGGSGPGGFRGEVQVVARPESGTGSAAGAFLPVSVVDGIRRDVGGDLGGGVGILADHEVGSVGQALDGAAVPAIAAAEVVLPAARGRFDHGDRFVEVGVMGQIAEEGGEVDAVVVVGGFPDRVTRQRVCFGDFRRGCGRQELGAGRASALGERESERGRQGSRRAFRTAASLRSRCWASSDRLRPWVAASAPAMMAWRASAGMVDQVGMVCQYGSKALPIWSMK